MGAIVYTQGEHSNSIQTQIDGVFQIELADTVPLYVAYGSVRQRINKQDLLSSHTIVLQTNPSSNGTSNQAGKAYVTAEKPFKISAEPSQTNLASQQELSSVNVYATKIDKRSYTGSISTITSSDIQKRPITNIANALSGAAPGVLVTTGSGQPGSAPDIMIRGQGSLNASTAPLIVLDGMPYDGTLVSINPNDVANMVVLKDAAAKARYGARGANGVIDITTKGSSNNYKLSGNLIDALSGKYKDENELPDLQQQVNELLTNKELRKVGISNESYEMFEENKFENPMNNPLSTFSIDVDRASYANVRRFITEGNSVPKDAVRVEEMINYFEYHYPQPQAGTPFSINTEYSIAPWNRTHQLLKIGLQGRTIPTDNIPASNLVFLIDVSGSMNEANKLPYVIESLKMLTMKLRKQDRVAIVVYAGAAGLVLPSTSGANKEKIMSAIYGLSAGGSTAGGQGITLAYKIAKQNFIPNGNNRIILATDGDFNVGVSDDRSMQELIEEKRKDNIFLTCLGFGTGNYKDSKMEILADKGNGNYAYIDNMNEATKILQKEFGGTMFAIAKDVKIQIEFNPAYVQSYRLIGYENRKLNAEDFANDAIDAGELGSGHTVTALYEIIPTGVDDKYAVKAETLKYTNLVRDSSHNFNNELAQIKFRYKEPTETKSKLVVQNITKSLIPLEQSSKDFKLASSVAWFGLKLRDSKLVPDKETKSILSLTQEAIDKENKEETELLQLIDAVK
ncbi:VWA domain-containing protein [Taibaiella sp. KBW10]|nr:VWA domain-containing protein [Taibaiella sp. KBW10]